MSAAKRYAKAVYDLALEGNSLDKVGGEFRELAKTLSESPDLAAVLSSPMVAPEVRKSLIDSVLGKMGVSALTRSAVLLIVDARRADVLPQISAALERLSDEKAGKVQAEVVSAEALSEAQYARVAASLEKLTGKKIALARKVDPTLIGGVVARVGDKVFDGSVASRLKELRSALLPN